MNGESTAKSETQILREAMTLLNQKIDRVVFEASAQIEQLKARVAALGREDEMSDTSDLSKIIDDRADWLIDGIATATQNRQFLRGDKQADDVAIDAIMMNGAKAIRIALQKALGVEIAPTHVETRGMNK